MSNSLVYQLQVAWMYCEKYRQYDKTRQTWSMVNALEAWNYRHFVIGFGVNSTTLLNSFFSSSFLFASFITLHTQYHTSTLI